MSFDAVSFCRDFSVPYTTERKGWVNVRCPFCSDHSNHGGINTVSGYYHCWKCGGKSLVDAVMKLTGLPFARASVLIQDYETHTGIVQRLNKKGSGVTAIKLPGGPLRDAHKKYLRGRKFDPDYLAEKYKLQGTLLDGGDWKYRVIIPIYYQGVLVSFQGRRLSSDKERRYKTLEPEKSIINPKHLLYGIDFCRGRSVVGVLEGAPSVWRMGDGWVATLGTSMTDYQIKLLSAFSRVVFLFDPEPEAQERARKSALKLAAYGVETEVVDPEGNDDPGDFSPDQAREISDELIGA